jgi:multidrug transporter EmrE-like cation transporter
VNAVTATLILTGVLLNAAAQLLLKAGANRVGPLEMQPQALAFAMREFATSMPVYAGLACYVVSVVVWIVALTRADVSIAYPMLSIGYVVNAIAAWMLFGEALTPMRLLGIAVIVLGVFILAGSARGS